MYVAGEMCESACKLRATVKPGPLHSLRKGASPPVQMAVAVNLFINKVIRFDLYCRIEENIHIMNPA
jgi:hypothetical protein